MPYQTYWLSSFESARIHFVSCCPYLYSLQLAVPSTPLANYCRYFQDEPFVLFSVVAIVILLWKLLLIVMLAPPCADFFGSGFIFDIAAVFVFVVDEGATVNSVLLSRPIRTP